MTQIMSKMPESDRRENLHAEQEHKIKDSLQKIKNKFMIMSGKGGVGKTSTSINLAIALADKGCKVGLMDVDLHGPDVPRMLGLNGLLGLNKDRRLEPAIFSENLKVVSIESLMPDKDDAIIWRGPIKYSAIQQFIGDVDWGALDFLIIDSPPGTGDEPLTIAQTITDARAIIVTTPQEISLADIRKSINFCRTVDMEIFGIIENMSGFNCPHCGKMVELFGSGGGERTSRELGLTFLGRIPFDPNVVICADTGTCYREAHKASNVTAAFDGLADKMAKLLG